MFGFLCPGDPFIFLFYFLYLILFTVLPSVVLIGFVHGLTKILTEARLAKDLPATGETPSQLNT